MTRIPLKPAALVIAFMFVASLASIDDASASTTTFNDFVGAEDSFQFNGVAGIESGVLRLTNTALNVRGSAFLKDGFSISSGPLYTNFQTSFRFRIADGNGGDGMVFVVQGESPFAVGDKGGNLGFDANGTNLRIEQSVGVEIDTFYNADTFECRPAACPDPAGQHVGIDIDGFKQSESLKVVGELPSVSSLRGESRYAWADYDGGSELLEVYVSDTDVRPDMPDLIYSLVLADVVGPEAFFGFAAATGGKTDLHDVEAWTLTVQTVPIPAGIWLFGASLLGLVLLRRIKTSRASV